ncbi:hypothetical protein ACO1O0_000487 [Amphichorda felina]
MAHPPPPGTNNLPARPPAASGGFSRSGFKPAFSVPAPQHSYGAAPTYGPSAPPPPPTQHHHQYGAPSYPSYSAPPGAAPAVSAAPPSYSSPSYSSYAPQPPSSYVPQSYGQPPSSYAAAAPPPQIRNPFPESGAGGASSNSSSSAFDPEMAAQIAQWQSAYVTRDSRDEGQQQPGAAQQGPGGSGGGSGRPAEVPPAIAAANANLHPDKKQTVVREGGGKKWTDDTLLEWDPSHLRLFVGNLAGETTDDALLKAFSRWESVQKARVIRDKRTTKSKGYGFVSFSNADDFFSAAKEMNGKYIQSHPVVVRKANTEIKVAKVKEKDHRGKKNNKNKKSGHGGGGGGGAAGGYDAHLGPYGGAGVTKPGQKTKNGLKLLG